MFNTALYLKQYGPKLMLVFRVSGKCHPPLFPSRDQGIHVHRGGKDIRPFRLVFIALGFKSRPFDPDPTDGYGRHLNSFFRVSRDSYASPNGCI